jgi:hypothetical protein
MVEAALLAKKFIIYFFYFCHFISCRTRTTSGSDSAKAKSSGSCGSSYNSSTLLRRFHAANLEREERVSKVEGLHAGPDHDPVGLVPLLGGGGAESSLHVDSEAGHLLGHLLAFCVLREEKKPNYTILYMLIAINVQDPSGTGYGSGS